MVNDYFRNMTCYSKLSTIELSQITGGTFGSTLRKYRHLAQLTEKEVAEKLNISISDISHYETDRRRPDFEFIRDFSKLADINISQLFVDL
jgi:transcriptional regulator with XRE-family HTH domain